MLGLAPLSTEERDEAGESVNGAEEKEKEEENKTLKEALEKEDESGDDPEKDADLSVRTMFLMAVATSIDALAVGISLAMVGSVNIWLAAAFIGICTCLLSALGVKIGNVFGSRYEKKAEFAGGVILILLGVKILLEHLGVLA